MDSELRLVGVIAGTGGAAFAVAATFADRLLVLTAALGLLFFLGFAMRDRAAGRPSLPPEHRPSRRGDEGLEHAGCREVRLDREDRDHRAGKGRDGRACRRHARGGTHWPARTLAKVAVVLPAQLFYLAEPTALAFPALLGLVTFLSAEDPAAGRAQLVVLLLGNLVGSLSAAAASAALEVGPPLPALVLHVAAWRAGLHRPKRGWPWQPGRAAGWRGTRPSGADQGLGRHLLLGHETGCFQPRGRGTRPFRSKSPQVAVDRTSR